MFALKIEGVHKLNVPSVNGTCQKFDPKIEWRPFGGEGSPLLISTAC